MRKIVTLMVTGIVAVSTLTGCGSSAPTEPEKQEITTTVDSREEKELQILEEITETYEDLGDVSFDEMDRFYEVRLTDEDEVALLRENIENKVPITDDSVKSQALLHDMNHRILEVLGDGYTIALVDPSDGSILISVSGEM